MTEGMPAVRRIGGLFRVAPLVTIGAVAGAGMLTMTPPGAPSVFATTQAAPVHTDNVELTGFFIGNGTQENPNAGLLIGTGYSYSSSDDTYCTSHVCNGGNAGLLFGNGGNGWSAIAGSGLAAGNGGSAGFLGIGKCSH